MTTKNVSDSTDSTDSIVYGFPNLIFLKNNKRKGIDPPVSPVSPVSKMEAVAC